jgi:hypothetical protein
VIENLARIVAAPPPLNRVDITVRGHPEGTLALQHRSGSVALLIDGGEVVELRYDQLRGGWLSVQPKDYWLQIDLGPRRGFRITLPLPPSYRHPRREPREGMGAVG